MDKPEAYQKGWREFYKLRFKVTPDVLIPRPETELLVDYVLNFIKQQQTTNNEPITILDMGTGSGNIAISLAKNLKEHLTSGVRVEVRVEVIASDISKKALKVAKQNAKLHEVKEKIIFIQSNLLKNINQVPDIIVTNLPYIPTERIPHLDSSVKDFEPLIALDGGEDGFELYRKLFQQLSLTPRRCKPKLPELIIGEIDYTHGELAVAEAQKYFPKAEVEVKTDLAHKQRILLIYQLL